MYTKSDSVVAVEVVDEMNFGSRQNGCIAEEGRHMIHRPYAHNREDCYYVCCTLGIVDCYPGNELIHYDLSFVLRLNKVSDLNLYDHSGQNWAIHRYCDSIYDPGCSQGLAVTIWLKIESLMMKMSVTSLVKTRGLGFA